MDDDTIMRLADELHRPHPTRPSRGCCSAVEGLAKMFAEADDDKLMGRPGLADAMQGLELRAEQPNDFWMGAHASVHAGMQGGYAGDDEAPGRVNHHGLRSMDGMERKKPILTDYVAMAVWDGESYRLEDRPVACAAGVRGC